GKEFQSVRPPEHSKCGAAERVEEIDASQGGIRGHVMGDVFRSELLAVAQGPEDGVGLLQIFQKEYEIRVQSGALDPAHGHGKPADQGVANASRVEATDQAGKCLAEVHGVRYRWEHRTSNIEHRRKRFEEGCGRDDRATGWARLRLFYPPNNESPITNNRRSAPSHFIHSFQRLTHKLGGYPDALCAHFFQALRQALYQPGFFRPDQHSNGTCP